MSDYKRIGCDRKGLITRKNWEAGVLTRKLRDGRQPWAFPAVGHGRGHSQPWAAGLSASAGAACGVRPKDGLHRELEVVPGFWFIFIFVF